MQFGHDFEQWRKFLNDWGETRKNKRIGSTILLFDEIDSTSSFIKENLSRLKEGTVVLARKQYAGRGQQQRRWLSEEGGLYFSIKICMDNVGSIQPFWIISNVAISVCEFLNSLDVQAKIKWPNDVLIGGKKVAGILTDNIYSKANLVSIIGIGINIANTLQDILENFPNLSNQITSVKKEYADFSEDDIKMLLSNVCDALEYQLNKDKPFTTGTLKEKWKELSKIVGKQVKISDNATKKNYLGSVMDISNNGALQVQLTSGKVKEFYVGEIKLLTS